MNFGMYVGTDRNQSIVTSARATIDVIGENIGELLHVFAISSALREELKLCVAVKVSKFKPCIKRVDSCL